MPVFSPLASETASENSATLGRDPATWSSPARPLPKFSDFGHVRATIKGIDEIFRRLFPFDYAILLTGQDYPIKSNRQIEDFFRRQEGRSFMQYFPLPADGWDYGGLDRINSWHLRVGASHLRFPADPPWNHAQVSVWIPAVRRLRLLVSVSRMHRVHTRVPQECPFVRPVLQVR